MFELVVTMGAGGLERQDLEKLEAVPHYSHVTHGPAVAGMALVANVTNDAAEALAICKVRGDVGDALG